ncbi:TlpA family protein disulfide reductase [Roseivirga echinicomitans]
MRNIKPLLFSLMAFVVFACAPKAKVENSVVITGELINFNNATKTLSARSSLESLTGNKDIELSVDANNRFSVSFMLEKEGYYSVGRNQLYLTPGDSLVVSLDYMDPNKATFEGKGAEVNRYLMDVPFPKSGSYLSGGRAVQSADIMAVVQLANMENATRLRKLEGLTTASEQFKEFEKLRLDLDFINTIERFPTYASFKDFFNYTDENWVNLMLPVQELLNNKAANLDQNKYMEHPNFRDMLGVFGNEKFRNNGLFTAFDISPEMKEFKKTEAFLSTLKSAGLVDSIVVQSKTVMAELKNPDYQNAIAYTLSTYNTLDPGNAAYDFVMNTESGEKHPLSQYKGQIIYVDFWATWCGPCIAEEPAYEVLKEDYKGKDIAFLSVSIDTSVKAWENYIQNKGWTEKTYLISQAELSDYKINGIPRYLLIDKDFNIISAFAPRPSDQKIRTMLDELL